MSKKPTQKRKPANKKPKAKKSTIQTKINKPFPWKKWFFRAVVVGVLIFSVWMVWLDAQVRERFDGKKWTLPAKVYARPLQLYPGKLMTPAQLNAELVWGDYRQGGYPTTPGYYFREGDRFVIYRRGFAFWDGAEPTRRLEVLIKNNRIERILEQNEEVALARLEPLYIGGIFPSHNEDRELLRLEDFPPELVAALVRTEDQYFFEHKGISLRGIGRAMVVNLKAGGVVQGGSTLTQQLVKNFFLTSQRSYTRKIQEAFMSILLELHYSKEEILETYLNEVYLGQAGRRAIHGFGLASRFYFAKPIQELDTAEIATLVGMVKGASYYNPRRNPKRAKSRRDIVLGIMAEHNIISESERLKAQSQSINTVSAQRAGQREYPAFLELVRQQLQEDYRLVDLQNEGLRVFTTLDPWLQHSVENAASEHLQKLETRFPQAQGKLQTAAVVTSTDGAEVRALLGGREPEYFGFNRALNAQRSIGSLAKPFVYLTALESGQWHWGSVLSDDPVSVSLGGGKQWQPQNYDKVSHGNVSMLTGLTQSYNQTTVRLGMNVGLAKVANNFNRLGLKTDLPRYPSILLGAVPLSPFNVAEMYQTIASNGFVMPLRSIEAVNDARGNLLSSYGMEGRQEVSPQTMQWLRWGLEQVTENGTARALKGHIPLPIAAKTGTSNDQRDAWFMGFDNRHLGIVWVGRDDNEPMPLFGSTAALPIWLESFKSLGVEPLAPATGFGWVKVNDQGEFVEERCAGMLYPLPKNQMPTELNGCGKSHKQEKRKSWLDWLF